MIASRMYLAISKGSKELESTTGISAMLKNNDVKQTDVADPW